ncbi:MAG: hypothetical protein GY866_12275 [Proteobacteria bacterium]|nr:hypothetical protein [Pseudomonadota bacterium]
MKFPFNRSIYYVVSLGMHSAILLALALFSLHRGTPVASFKTTVFFESAYEKRPLPNDTSKKKTSPKKKSNPTGFLRAKEKREIEADRHPRPTTDESSKTPTTKEVDEKTSAVAKTPTSDPLFAEHKYQNVEKPSPGKIRRPTGKRTDLMSTWRKKNDLITYRSILAKLITANWVVPPVSIKSFQILMEASIDARGNITEITLVKSSGLAILDAAAERAIRVSTPFPEFPQSFDPEMEVFHAVFRFTPDKVAQ